MIHLFLESTAGAQRMTLLSGIVGWCLTHQLAQTEEPEVFLQMAVGSLALTLLFLTCAFVCRPCEEDEGLVRRLNFLALGTFAASTYFLLLCAVAGGYQHLNVL